jgi:hypothetical protein
MKNINYIIASFSLLISVLIVDCISPTAGVETTNGATVVMKEGRVEGTSPPFASVYIFDTSYIPYVDTGLGVATASDEDGFFSVQQINAKNLNVQVFDNRKRIAVLMAIGADGETHRSELKLPGTLSGNVETSSAGKVMVFICGTGYYVLLNGSGEWRFKELPPASYKVQAVLLSATAVDGKPAILSSSAKVSVNVISDEVTKIADKLVIQ